MNQKELYTALQINAADHAFLKELHEKLDLELTKPIDERDFDRIEDLIEAITTMEGTEQLVQAQAAEAIPKLQQENHRRKITLRKNRLKVMIPCACAAVVLAANIWSVAALERNIFSATVNWFKGGFTLQMSEPDEIVVPVTDEDPYGITEKCEEYGFTPLTPTYLPEGFALDDIITNTSSKSSSVLFYYRKDNFLKDDALLNFHFTHYNANDTIPPVGLSSDGTPPEEELINGITMYTLKEDDQFSATFIYQNTVYVIFGRDLDYDECYKVISSFAAAKE